MTDLAKKLDELHAAGKMHGFSLWPSQGGYQASLAVTPNSFRIRHAATPGEAIEALFDGGPLEHLPEPEVSTARDSLRARTARRKQHIRLGVFA